tara:strand:- start:200 stop:625 length:426 start_codon:yes stop_codon:yes gene_type:complete
MANRVLIGTRNSQEGIYVSRPGKNVLTCSDDELLFRMDDGASGTIKGLYQLQPISGTNSTATTSVSAGTTATVSITNFSWTNGVVPYALGALASGGAGNSAGLNFQFGSVSTSSIQITNTLGSSINVTLAASPVMFSGALF